MKHLPVITTILLGQLNVAPVPSGGLTPACSRRAAQGLHLIAVLIATALLASCANVEFDNPLDPNGNNYLWNYDVTPEEEKEMIQTGSNGNSARLWTDEEFTCDRRNPVVNPIGDNPARIKYGDPQDIQKFKAYMGLLDNYWFSAAYVERGMRNTVVEVEIKLSTDKPSADKPDVTEHEYIWETPEPGTYYIVYTATKPPCGEGRPPTSDPAVREVIVYAE